MEGPGDDATTSNVVEGDVFGTVVQTGDIHGDLHIHSAPTRRRPATIAHRLTRRPPWLATVLGSPGLLVDERRVITVADVSGSVRVRFPHADVTREAVVIERHQDVSVLRLAEPVALTPAPLSSRESLRSTTSDGVVFDHDLEAVVGLVAPDGRTLPVTLPGLRTGWRLDLDAALQTHWLPRAHGSEVESDSGESYFTGREAARQAIHDWVAADSPLLVVTGGPGSGKSAVLAHVLVTAGSFDIAVHTSGLTFDDVLARLAAGADVDATTSAELIVALRELDHVPVILVDAVEEAASVDAARDIAALLRDLATSGVARVLAAVRTAPAGSERARILTAFGRSAPRIDLDSPQYLHKPDVVDYVCRRLPGLSREDAGLIAVRAQHNFLIAQLTTRWLAGREFDVSELPETVGQALDKYLDACGPDRALVRRVLTALAFARGEGLSRDSTWLTIADALHSGHRHTLLDLDTVFQSAANYLVERHDGQYRLYHRALDEHLQEHHRSPEAAITKALAQHNWSPYTLRHLPDHAVAAGMLDELLDDLDFVVHAEPSGLLASLRHTRTRHGRLVSSIYRVSQHLHVEADPSTRRRQLAVDAARFRANDLRDKLNALDESSWQVRFATGHGVSPATVAMLSGHTQQISDLAIAGEVAFSFGSDAVRAWDLADLRQLAKFEGDVTSLAATVWRGTPVALIGCVDGTVRLWDPAEDREVGRIPCPDRETAVTDIIVCDDVVVTAHRAPGWEGLTLWLWDLRTLESAGRCHTNFRRANEVSHIAVARAGTRLIGAVTDSRDDQVEVLDLGAGRQVGRIAFEESPGCFTIAEVDGKLIGFSASESTIEMVDLLNRRSLGRMNADDDIETLVAVRHRGGTVLLGGTVNGSVCRWDVATTRLISELRTGHDDVNCLAVATVHGRFLALTTSWPDSFSGVPDQRIGVLDLDTTPIPEVADRSTGTVSEVAISEFEGGSVVLAVQHDPVVQHWNLADGQHLGAIYTFPHGSDQISAVGTPALAVHEAAEIWDLTEQQLVGKLDYRAIRPTVAIAESDGKAVVAVCDNAFLDVWTVTPRKRAWKPVGKADLDSSLPQYVSSAAIGRIDGRLVVAIGFTASPSAPGAVQGLEVWDPVSRRDVVKISTGHPGGIWALALATVGGHLFAATAAYEDPVIRIWDLSTGRSHGGLAGHEDTATSAIMASLGGRTTVITGSFDRTIRLWDLETQECVEVVRLPERVTCMAIGGRGTLVFGQGSDVVAMSMPGLTALTPSQRPL
ncbi:hypothetical protein UK23_30625 [Lentzea aerocolonigenes]|uniref:Uncharacterized protein n=1 Tax=Lentzea aerocolonigenes TaxID=68170 RepID=A0A0F0GLD5_LENAE|nr:AAA family ATPase [Lentzea aerocolonigenes]KJK44105.1 hypothetical protein UK23_30625 [Lentzea aerocolonigenes]